MKNGIRDAAFPQVGTPSCDGVLVEGLSKREYFAGLAMQNLQNVLLRKSGEEKLKANMLKNNIDSVYEVIAKEAVLFADALLRELDDGADWMRSQLKLTHESAPTEPAVLVLPKEKEEPLEQTAENVDTFRYVRTWNRCLSEVRRLNPSLKVSVGE